MNYSYRCNSCGQVHEGLPFTWASSAPARYYDIPEDERTKRVEMSSDQCIIDDAEYFVLGRIHIPVSDSEDDFYWLGWVELSEADFERVSELWHTPGRESEPAYAGRLQSVLPGYSDTTLNVKVRLQTRPVGERPLIELESNHHPLAAEQKVGITMSRVQEIAEVCIHG